jgi:hypothetical protein
MQGIQVPDASFYQIVIMGIHSVDSRAVGSCVSCAMALGEFAAIARTMNWPRPEPAPTIRPIVALTISTMPSYGFFFSLDIFFDIFDLFAVPRFRRRFILPHRVAACITAPTAMASSPRIVVVIVSIAIVGIVPTSELLGLIFWDPAMAAASIAAIAAAASIAAIAAAASIAAAIVVLSAALIKLMPPSLAMVAPMASRAILRERYRVVTHGGDVRCGLLLDMLIDRGGIR